MNNIEQKWQKKWEAAKIFEVNKAAKKKKLYVLEMFPYPSGSGLHMGHAFNYTIGDVYARFKRMNGFNVLYPMGYDSFGLPAENAAIKAQSHPRKFTDEAIANFIKQQKALGLSYDWRRIVKTSDPEYYKWNQYFFLKFLKKELVYKKKASINWCPDCETVLANEQVHSGKCWRHKETDVEEKHLEQWFIKTTKYADELLKDIDKLDWPERIKAMQKNWIGKSYGVDIFFRLADYDKILSTFTTRCDTIYSVTFLAVAPEHELVEELTKGTKYEKGAKEFVDNFKRQSIADRTNEEKAKQGFFLGRYAINPVNSEKIPIYIANFALMYGSGIVMCDAHDKRDFEFAKKYNIQLKFVISRDGKSIDANKANEAYTDDGILFDSGKFSGIPNKEALLNIADWIEKQGYGKKVVNYKLKDWLVSRQRYWGTPIPVIYCNNCGIVPVQEKDLPVLLPREFKTGTGNPLALDKKFVEAKCPNCKRNAKRETDTMDTFFDSSWYFLRYTDNKNSKKPFDFKKTSYWMPVDQYIGGAEHACMHLIYARFFTKALRDLGFISIDEPFTKLFNQGMLHGSDGHVMSKSRGNIVLPEATSEKYGIDTARFFLLSIALPDKDREWDDKGIESTYKFIQKILQFYKEVNIGKSSKKVQSKLNKSIKEITLDIDEFRYNSALLKLKQLFDSFSEEESKDTLEKFLKLIHPFCPHISEELWEKLGNKHFLSLEKWPKSNEKKIDPLLEYEENLFENLIADIRAIQELTKIDKLNEIKLIISQDWKYKLFNKLKELLEKTRDQREIIKSIMNSDLKKYSGDIMKILPLLLKDRSKIPLLILDQKAELKIIEEEKVRIETEFNAKVVLEIAEKSTEQKAKQANPGKPAIVVS